MDIKKEDLKLNDVMIMLKVADFLSNELLYTNTIFKKREETLDFYDLANAYGILYEDLKNCNYYIFIEPSSNLSIQKKIIKYSSING